MSPSSSSSDSTSSQRRNPRPNQPEVPPEAKRPPMTIRKLSVSPKTLVKGILAVLLAIILIIGCLTYIVISIGWYNRKCEIKVPRPIQVRHHQHTSFTSRGNVTIFQSFSFVQLFSPTPESLVSYASIMKDDENDLDLLDFQSSFRSYSSDEYSRRTPSQICWPTLRKVNLLNPLPNFVLVDVPIKNPFWEDSFYDKVIKGFDRLMDHLHYNITRVYIPGDIPTNIFTRDGVDKFVQKFGDDHFEFVVSGVKFIVSNSNYDYKPASMTDNGTRGVSDLKAEQESWMSQSLEDSRWQTYRHVVLVRAGLRRFAEMTERGSNPEDDQVRSATYRFLDDIAKYDRVTIVTYDGVYNRSTYPRLDINRQMKDLPLFTERDHFHPPSHRGLQREYKKVKRIFLATDMDSSDFRVFHVYEEDIEQQIFH